MSKKDEDNFEMPLGLGIALGKNAAAMATFGSLSEAQRNDLLEKAGQVESKEEMENLVAHLVDDVKPLISPAASSTECTGLMPSAVLDADEEESYKQIYTMEVRE